MTEISNPRNLKSESGFRKTNFTNIHNENYSFRTFYCRKCEKNQNT